MASGVFVEIYIHPSTFINHVSVQRKHAENYDEGHNDNNDDDGHYLNDYLWLIESKNIYMYLYNCTYTKICYLSDSLI